MGELVIGLAALCWGSAVIYFAAHLAVTDEPPRWFVTAWNAVAHPLRLPRYAKGGTARTSGLVAATSCDLGQHPRQDVENPFRSVQMIDEWDRYCRRCKTHFKEMPRG